MQHGRRVVKIGRDAVKIHAKVARPEPESLVSVNVVSAVSREREPNLHNEGEGGGQNNEAALARQSPILNRNSY